MGELTLSAFGAPLLAKDGAPVKVQRRKVMAVLVYLAVTGQAHAREHLLNLFWPEEQPHLARAALRRTLSELAKVVGVAVSKTGADGVGLAKSPEMNIDVVEFRRCLQTVHAHVHLSSLECHACCQNLVRAVQLYQGDFLAGFSLKDCPAFDSWECLEQENLRREFTAALRQLVEIHQAHGEIEPAVQSARRWLAADPTDEAAHRLLMQVYAADGQAGAVRRQYEACASILESELGSSPAPETEKLFRSLCPPNRTSPAPARPKSARRAAATRHLRLHNLPAQATSFIGRQQELEALARLLGQPDTRLVTLTGTGGVGKTRLSLQLGERIAGAFHDGVCFVPLAALSSPDLVAQAIALQLGLRGVGDELALELLKDWLRHKRLLLILDNFEHLQPAAPQVGELLAAAPGLKMIATSRAPLQVYGEQLFPVAPLVLPRPGLAAARQSALDFDSVQLFVERARLVQPDFCLNAENTAAVVQVCRRLDGLPLAIELAASHAGWLLPTVMENHLGGPHNLFPFHLLEGGPHDQLARHQTMHNAIAWSFALLKPNERAFFRRFGVFAGGAGLEALQAVCGDNDSPAPDQHAAGQGSLEDWLALETLHKQALLVQSEAGDTARFHMLELIRAFALEKLRESGEEERVRERHAAYYLELATALNAHIDTPDQQVWLKALEQERDNLRSILDWSLLPSELTALESRLRRVLLALAKMHLSFGEQHNWIVKALARLEATPTDGQGETKARLSIDLCNRAASSAHFHGDYAAARFFHEKCLALGQSLDGPDAITNLHIGYAWTLLALDDVVGARSYAEKVLKLAQAAQAWRMIAHALNHLGNLAWIEGDYPLAEQLSTESLLYFQKSHSQVWEGIQCLNLCSVLQDAGRLEDALIYCRKGLHKSREISSRWVMGMGIEKMARLAAGLGRYEQAARWFAAAETAFTASGYSLEPPDRSHHTIYLEKTRSRLDEPAFAAAWEAGLGLSLDQAVVEALGE